MFSKGGERYFIAKPIENEENKRNNSEHKLNKLDSSYSFHLFIIHSEIKLDLVGTNFSIRFEKYSWTRSLLFDNIKRGIAKGDVVIVGGSSGNLVRVLLNLVLLVLKIRYSRNPIS